jgi:hypothetical protein
VETELPEEKRTTALRLLNGLLAIGSETLTAPVVTDSTPEQLAAQAGIALDEVLHTDNHANGSESREDMTFLSSSAQFSVAALYDAVWVTAAGWAAAAQMSDGGELGADAFLGSLTNSSVGVGFQGVTGRMQWGRSGDLDDDVVRVGIYNFHFSGVDDVAGGSVGLVSLMSKAGGVEGSLDLLQWPDGSFYPQVRR